MEETTLSKKSLKKLAKKERIKAVKSNLLAVNSNAAQTVVDYSAFSDLFGFDGLEIKPRTDFNGYTKIEHFSNHENEDVWIRARIHSKRKAILDSTKSQIPKEMTAWASKITNESIVDIFGTVLPVPTKIINCTQQDVEIKIKKMFVVSSAGNLKMLLQDCLIAEPLLQIQRQKIMELHDLCDKITANLKITQGEQEIKNLQAQLVTLNEEKEKISVYRDVDQSTRLDNRVIDLRTFANQAIFDIQSAVVSFFREFLIKENFVEIHTPKLVGAASEGGAEIFRVNYFGKEAYLSQSPQLYKQMAISSDFERVFEIGPVFRAENSLGHRHMTEFVGLDIEMQIEQNYHETLDILEKLFVHIFQSIETKCAKQLEVISRQYPFEPIRYLPKTLRLEYPEVVKILNDANVNMGDYEDLNTVNEKLLGKIVSEKYHTDFYVIDKFPLNVRPFYTMHDFNRPTYANAYDMFIRGEEVCSGSQRIHDPELLIQRATDRGVSTSSIEAYIEAFRIGCPPHAGGGIGLERILLYYLGLPNIRKTSMFPRDPLRLYP